MQCLHNASPDLESQGFFVQGQWKEEHGTLTCFKGIVDRYFSSVRTKPDNSLIALGTLNELSAKSLDQLVLVV